MLGQIIINTQAMEKMQSKEELLYLSGLSNVKQIQIH